MAGVKRGIFRGLRVIGAADRTGAGERCGREEDEITMFGRRNLSFNLPQSATEGPVGGEAAPPWFTHWKHEVDVRGRYT